MYHKVVVPLDGSKLAETAIPHLEEIARGCQIPEIYLISVTEPIRGVLKVPDEVKLALEKSENPLAQTNNIYAGMVSPAASPILRDMPVTLGKMGKTALNYLNKIAQQLRKKGFQTEVRVLIGSPADEILRFVEEQQADLIVMASRGESGFSNWDIGSITGKVVRAARVPVFLVKPEAGFKETKSRRKGTPN